MSAIWDVVVVGAGPAGAVAAYVLARGGRRVLFVDDVKPDANKVGESLPGAARRLLRDLDLLALVNRGPHLTCYGNVSAWGSSKLLTTDFIRDPHGLGWHLDRASFDADLRRAAQDAGVVHELAQVRQVCSTADGWHLALTNGQTHARWLIDATGRRSFVARSQGARRISDDSLVALYTWAVPQKGDRDTRTLVESAPDGWWYTALLPNNTRVVVFHVDAENAAPILRTSGAWESHLRRTTHVHQMLAGATFTSRLRVTKACGARLSYFAGHGWVATGDAALSFDPLSSQGILNALYTGMKGGQAVLAALAGPLGPLEAYLAQLEQIRTAYLRRHRLVYQAERRWPKHAFWARRHSAGTSERIKEA